jgi:hypothetical protein
VDAEELRIEVTASTQDAKDKLSDMQRGVNELREAQAKGVATAMAVAAITGSETAEYKRATDAIKDTTDAMKDNTRAAEWNAVTVKALLAAQGGGAGGGAWAGIAALPGIWAQVAIAIGIAAAALWPFTMLMRART